jgi:hypothetical protein
VSLIRKSFTNLISPSATANDDVFAIKQHVVSYEHGFNINYTDGFKETSDVKINNYSSLYLTNLKTDEEIFTFNELTDTQNDYITYIAYRSPNGNYMLYFDDVNTYTTPGAHSFSFMLSSEVIDTSRTYFEIETITETFCRIKRRQNEVNYYLAYDNASPVSSRFYFTTSVDVADYVGVNLSNPDTFSYVLDNQGFAIFAKRFNDNTVILGVDPTTVEFVLYPYTTSFNYLTQKTLFGVQLIDNIIKPKMNTSFVSYDTDTLNDLSINQSKSIFGLKNNNIIHLQYNDITDINEIKVNVIKTKNQHTNKNILSRGNSNIITSDNLPAPFFREYTSLNTGNSEEGGYDDINLNYVFYNQDYLIESGKHTFFTAPSSIFPYTTLNINDTTIAKDGGICSTTPVLADKIYKTTEISDPLKGNYLVTWLSGAGGSLPVWVDRYYFPNITSIQNALSGDPIFEPTFANPTSQIAYNNQSSIVNQPYYDIISNFTVLPSETYSYERIGNDYLLNYIDNYRNIVQYDFNSYITPTGNVVPVSATELSFTGDKIVSIPIDKVNSTGSFTVFFEIEGSWKNEISYIFGSLVDAGFGVYNDNRVTPFNYLHNGKSVYVYNKNNSLIYSVSFPSDVLDIITENHVDNYFVTTSHGNTYCVGADGTIKEKYSTVQLASLSGQYLNYHKSGSNIHFLNTTYGDYTTLDTNTGNLKVSTAVQFISSTTPYLLRSIHEYNGIVYGFQGDRVKIKGTTLYNLISNARIESYNLNLTGVSDIFVESNTYIEDFNVDDNGKVYVLHNSNKLAIIDSNRKFISDTTLIQGFTSHRIDFVSDFVNGKRQMYPIILLSDEQLNYWLMDYTPALSATPTQLPEISKFNDLFDYNNSYRIAYPEDTPLFLGDYNSYVGDLSNGSTSVQMQAIINELADGTYDNFLATVKPQSLTNYNYYINNTSYKTLNFDMKLKNIYNPSDVTNLQYSIELDKLSDYSNNICVMYDDKEGEYSIYINYNKLFSQVVDKSKYTFNVLLNNSFYIGTLGFYNNITLAQFVKIPGFLYGGDFKVKNLRYFNSKLTTEQIQGLFLQNAGVSHTYITLPCGQRNNNETIKTLFKFTQPYIKSNSINVLVKNTNITTQTLQREISGNIVNNLQDTLPGDVTINSVKFINY